jgi:uncharacterized protein (DUF1697 family)
MTKCVALLRAINLAGRNKVSMRDLRDLFGAHGFEDAETVLQSGNVVFRTDAPAGDVERLLEDAVAGRLGTKCARPEPGRRSSRQTRSSARHATTRATLS